MRNATNRPKIPTILNEIACRLEMPTELRRAESQAESHAESHTKNASTSFRLLKSVYLAFNGTPSIDSWRPASSRGSTMHQILVKSEISFKYANHTFAQCHTSAHGHRTAFLLCATLDQRNNVDFKLQAVDLRHRSTPQLSTIR